MKQPYHSALKPELEQESLERVLLGDPNRLSVAFVHDVFQPLPGDYGTCDVLYAEPAWRAGFETFNQRAGVQDDGRTYKAYMAHVGASMASSGLPAFLLVGAHAKKLVPPARRVLELVLDVHNCGALCMVYGVDYDGTPATQTALIQDLAKRFHRVGDCCCGYGWTGQMFAEAGRSFVLSDVNAKCIGYIAKHGPSWFCDHDWIECEGEPPADVCNSCGKRRE